MNGMSIRTRGTGLAHIRILAVERKGRPAVHYYLDRTDQRFLVLHTNDHVEDTDPIIRKIITSDRHQFDSAWLHTDMLKHIARNFGNRPLGYGIRYEDIFNRNDSPVDPRTDLKIDVSGAISNKVIELIRDNDDIRSMLGYERVSINRGTNSDAVLESLDYSGRFRLVKGDSIDEHVSLIEHVTGKYRKTIEDIEGMRVRAEEKEGRVVIEGNSFTFEFERRIEDWDRFLPRIFNAREPFRIWGLRSDVEDGVQRFLCIDMHTGDQLNMEVGGDAIRVYLLDSACGNVVLRLYTNLQRYVDANMRCGQLGM